MDTGGFPFTFAWAFGLEFIGLRAYKLVHRASEGLGLSPRQSVATTNRLLPLVSDVVVLAMTFRCRSLKRARRCELDVLHVHIHGHVDA